MTFADSFFHNPASGLLQIGKNSGKWQWRHNVPKWRQRQFFLLCFVSLVNFSYWSKFHVNIITGSWIMTISFIRDWPEIRKSEIPSSVFSPISEDWSELWIPNLARMPLTECYSMLQIPGLQLLPFLSY